MIARSHVTAVCRPGHGAATCRYLGADGAGWVCFKTATGPIRSLAGDSAVSAKVMMDQRVARGQMVAQGDNCDGWKEGAA